MKREIKGRKFLKRKVFKQANSIGPYLLRKEPPFQSNVSKTERIYYYLEDKKLEDQGIIVFDELEKSKSHILVSQLENYFKKTSNGRQRSGLVIPEPFFVHSDLTTGIQIADKFDRTLIKVTEDTLLFYSDKKIKDKLYDVIENADYMINVASLKPHGSAGVSLTAKNHFGSQARRGASHLHYSSIAPTWETSPREVGNPSNGGYKKYRVMVDLLGSRYLGQNTMLYIVDGLFGGGADETKGPVKYFMAPFNNDWSNSIFSSQDEVALESVCFDFLRSEWDGKNIHNKANNVCEWAPNMPGVDDYLHQSADSKNWPVGIVYDPDNSGKPLGSLGVHEHWNNPADKQYSGNLGVKNGISLVSIPENLVKSKEQLKKKKTRADS